MRDGLMLILGLLVGLSVYESFGASKTFDEKKWERIQKNREIRRANEFRYESCARECLQKCPKR